MSDPACSSLSSLLQPQKKAQQDQKNSEEGMKGHDVFDGSSSLLFSMEVRTSRLSKLLERCYPLYQ